jgi:hypothetical protein
VYGMGKVRENQTLIHQSEVLNIEGVFAKVAKLQGG